MLTLISEDLRINVPPQRSKDCRWHRKKPRHCFLLVEHICTHNSFKPPTAKKSQLRRLQKMRNTSQRERFHQHVATQSMRNPPRVTLCREPGHTTPAVDWRKSRPNDSCCKENGHRTPAMGWLKTRPNDSFRREAGHTAPAMG